MKNRGSRIAFRILLGFLGAWYTLQPGLAQEPAAASQNSQNDTRALARQRFLEILRAAPPVPMPAEAKAQTGFGPAGVAEYDPQSGQSTVSFSMPSASSNSGEPGQVAGKPAAALSVNGAPVDRPLQRLNHIAPVEPLALTTLSVVPDTKIDPWVTAYKLLLRFNTGGVDYWYSCSAVAAASFHLLTAGHCIYSHDIKNDGSNIAGWAQEVWAWPGATDQVSPIGQSDFPLGTSKSTFLRTYSQWQNSSDLNWDIGVITLDRKIGDNSGWWSREFNVAVPTLTFTGYPTETPYVPAGTLFQYSGTNANADYSSTRITLNALQYGGHDGGPQWRLSNGTWFLHGINSTTNRTGTAVGTRYTSTIDTDLTAWIAQDNAARPPVARPELIEYVWDTSSKDLLTSAANPGNVVTVKYNVTNIGFAQCGRLDLDFYLSTDTVISTADTFIGNLNFPDISPLSAFISTTDLTVPGNMPSGNYYAGWLMRCAVAQYNNGTPAVPGYDYDIRSVVIPTKRVLIGSSLDLGITKTHTGNFTQGQVGAAYTIAVSNVGTAPISGTVTVTDTLPAGLTATAISGSGWSCAQPGGPCTRSDALVSGGSYPPITLTVNVAGNAAGSVTNTAEVSGGGDTNSANNTATDPTTILAAGTPDLSISKTHSGNFAQGQVGAIYTITVSNVGTLSTSGTVTVTETVPVGLTATAMSGTGWNCGQPAGPCTRSDALAASASYPPITLTVTVAANAAANVSNFANVSGGGETNTANNTAADPTTIVPVPPDLTILKTHSGNFTQGQAGAVYSIVVSNIGTGSTSGTVTMTETVPAGLTATAISGTGWNCTQPAGPCSRSDVLLPAASYPAITLTVTVAGNAAASVTNTASVSGGGESNTANNIATDPTIIGALVPDLTIGKTHVGNFTQGQAGATYTITVSNTGTGPTTGTVTVTDTLPAGLTATAVSGTGWNCTQPAGPCSRSDALAAGSSYPPITLTVTVAGNAAAIVTNTATVLGGGETNTNNNIATNQAIVVPVVLPPDLTIGKTHTGSFTQGQAGATYTITVTNNGTGPTSGVVTVTDSVPAGLTATAIAGTGWNCAQPAGPCTRSDALAAGASYPPITLTVTVAGNAAASITNVAAVSGGGETNTANNTATDPTTILPVGCVYPESTHPYLSNFDFTWTCTITGNPASLNVTFDPQTSVEPGADWIYVMDGNGVNIAGSPFTGLLLAGQTKNVVGNTVKIRLLTNGRFTDWGFKVTNVSPGATPGSDLTVSKTHTGSFVQGQAGATYNIAVTNSGAGPTSGTVSVSDTLPAGLTATSIAGTGWSCTQPAGPCTRSDVLAAGGTYPVIALTVNVAGNASASVTNTATVSGGGDTNTANNTATDPTAILTPLAADLTIAKTHTGNFRQGQVGAVYTIVISNVGSGPSSGTVTVTDTLPAGMTATAISGAGWNCTQAAGPCTRSDALAAGSSYPPITLTVTVAGNAAASLTNTATVSGGSDTNTSNNTATNPTTITPAGCTLPESTHPYLNNFDFTWTCAVADNPLSINVTFDPQTSVEAGADWIYVMDGNGINIPGSPFTGLLLAGQTKNVTGAVVKIRLVTNGRFTDWGFKVTSVVPIGSTGPDLAVNKSHTGNFLQGQAGVTYNISVSNSGTDPTSGTVTVTDTLPAGLTATSISGSGWSCTQPAGPCTRSDVLPAGSAYPVITLTVNVAGNAPSSVTNTATVSGGGDANSGNNTALDPTTIVPPQAPDLTLTKVHAGNFFLGQVGANYVITVRNIGTGPSTGTVTVVDTIPAGLTPTGISGTGWSCAQPAGPCTRSDALATGGSYPPITLIVNVNVDSLPSITNTATVSGGGDANGANNTAADPTTVSNGRR